MQWSRKIIPWTRLKLREAQEETERVVILSFQKYIQAVRRTVRYKYVHHSRMEHKKIWIWICVQSRKIERGLKYLHVSFYFSFHLKILFIFVQDFSVKHRRERAMSLKVYRGETSQMKPWITVKVYEKTTRNWWRTEKNGHGRQLKRQKQVWE